MILKYSEDIKRISDEGLECPPSGIYEMRGVFFRFGHLEQCKGFIYNNMPVKKITPDRILRNESEVKCMASTSLSCFETLESIKGHFIKLKSVNKNIYKSIGCSIFKFDVDLDDGLRSNSGLNGHFSFFESETADLSSKAVLVEILAECES